MDQQQSNLGDQQQAQEVVNFHPQIQVDDTEDHILQQNLNQSISQTELKLEETNQNCLSKFSTPVSKMDNNRESKRMLKKFQTCDIDSQSKDKTPLQDQNKTMVRSPSFEARIQSLEKQYGQAIVTSILTQSQKEQEEIQAHQNLLEISEEQNLITLDVPKSQTIVVDTKSQGTKEAAGVSGLKKMQMAKFKIGVLKRTGKEQILLALKKEKLLRELESGNNMRTSWQKEQLELKLNRISCPNKSENILNAAQQKKVQIQKEEQLDINQNFNIHDRTFLMKNMSKEKTVETSYDIIVVYFIHKTNQIVALSKHTNRRFSILIWNVNYGIVSKIIDIDGKYLQATEISFSPDKENYAITYNDDGEFMLLVFNDKDIKRQFNINKIVEVDQQTNNMQTPLINCTFVNNELILINYYDQKERKNSYFIYNFVSHIVEKKTKTYVLPEQFQSNFPVKIFYEMKSLESQYEIGQLQIFFRDGQCLKLEVDQAEESSESEEEEETSQSDKEKVQLDIQNVTNTIEQIFFYKKRILIVNSCNSIKFFKKEIETFSQEQKQIWKCYFTLDQQGDIYLQEGTDWMTLQTNEKFIQFFKFNKENYNPEIKLSMGNNFDCSHLIYSESPELCITYKEGQQDFKIHQRRFFHANRVIVDQNSYCGYQGIDCKSMNSFIVFDKTTISIFQYDTYKPLNQIEVNLTFMKSQGIHILNLSLSQDETHLLIVLGKKISNFAYELTNMLIYEQQKLKQNYIFRHLRKLTHNIKNSSNICVFSNQNINEVLFTNAKEITKYNYMTLAQSTHYSFKQQLNCQPEFVVFSQDQKQVMIASFYDVCWIDFQKNKELDIDDEFGIGDIRAIKFNHQSFFILANKSARKLGYYLIQIYADNPVDEKKKPIFLISQKSYFDTGNANIHFMKKEQDENDFDVVISQKTIKINTYTVQVLNQQSHKIQHQYEKSHFWENQIRGLLLSSNDFVQFGSDGMSVLNLQGKNHQKTIVDRMDNQWVLHSLSSCNYLKIDTNNFVMIEEGKNHQTRRLKIQNQHKDSLGETIIADLFKIKIQNMSLIEVLLFKSIYNCNQQSEIVQIIQNQPFPQVFFKSFDEIQMSNMITQLSYDSRPIQILLNEKNQQYFNPKYPLFYMFLADQKPSYMSALDISLESNQFRATSLIVDYIIKYQNSFVFSHLFKTNLISFIKRGVQVSKLLSSKIFRQNFSFELWPSTHLNQKSSIQFYNSSYFELREKYNEIFPDNFGQNYSQNLLRNYQNEKVYKIKYTLNVLPSIEVNEESLMGALSETEELEIFNCQVVKELIEFKWKNYAGKYHYIGASIHCIFVCIFNYYVSYFLQINFLPTGIDENGNKFVTEQDKIKEKNAYIQMYILNAMMMVCLIYPFVYDMTQLFKQSFGVYIQDKWNIIDQCHIWGGYINTIIQMCTYRTQNQFLQKMADCGLIFQAFIMLIKTFFYLRINSNLSYLVTMMKKVFFDLRIFMLFYMILILMFSSILGILQLGNFELSSDIEIQQLRHQSSYPNYEYRFLPYFLQHIFTVTRISLGDFDFEAAILLDPFENIIFWVVWFIIVTMTSVIFLNFIIAEVSSSYQSVKIDVQGLILKERASLIAESEEMMIAKSRQNKKLFPKYLIKREQEE